jgi:hypothetical protein
MFKLFISVIAVMLLYPAARATATEWVLTCAWERGGKFDLKINEQGVTKNGRVVTDDVSISEDRIVWHETAPSGHDYEYNLNRHSGVLVASTFSGSYNRKVENKAVCVKTSGSSGAGF